jgi:hypothetical protein
MKPSPNFLWLTIHDNHLKDRNDTTLKMAHSHFYSNQKRQRAANWRPPVHCL